jgi:DNA replication protein DnaC
LEPLDFIRSRQLNTIPSKKWQAALSAIQNSADDPKAKMIKTQAINRYAESNIPIEYWNLRMDKDFVGDKRLLEKYQDYIADISQSYINGKSICLAGNHGCGKTFTTTCILKKCVQKGYSALYTTSSDIVSVLTQAPYDEKLIAKRELVMVDFLVIDELDGRFWASDTAGDLFGRSLEIVFRTRSQNKLPTIICTNSPNMIESFTGPLKASLDSLMQGYMEFFPVLGSDFRKQSSSK